MEQLKADGWKMSSANVQKLIANFPVPEKKLPSIRWIIKLSFLEFSLDPLKGRGVPFLEEVQDQGDARGAR